jgi:uncharacterized protein (DUF58 family)
MVTTKDIRQESLGSQQSRHDAGAETRTVKPSEILKQVRRLEIKTRKLVHEVFSGEYHSVFKGQGIEFSEVREYSPGDDIRSIDWNVTARLGHPYIKKFTEERQLNVFILLDVSNSQAFGTHRFKQDIAAELAAVLAFSTLYNNDKAGLLLFSDQIEKYLPPRKNKKYAMRLIREILFFEPRSKGTHISKALEYLLKVNRKRCVVFLISDFLDQHFEKPLRIAAKKHDIVALQIQDPIESAMPKTSLIQLEDAESGETTIINSSNSHFQKNYMQQKETDQNSLKRLFQSMGIDHVLISTDKPFYEPLNKLFKLREKRRG